MALSKVDLENQVENILPETLGGTGASQFPAQFRNIIINGDMSIAQRGTSVSGITGVGYNTADRWLFSVGALGTWTQSQSTDVPSNQGFAKSLKIDCTTAKASPDASNYALMQSRFEGQNLQYLKKGTASAESLTLSFWVKSNKTGTYVCEIDDADNSRNINKSYTINSANTWEKKEITFAGDTTGVFTNDNNLSMNVIWWLGAGSNYTSGTLNNAWESTTNSNRAVGQVNLADSTSNEWYITGVQLEAGTTASDFEFLPYDVNLRRCQRYYQTLGFGNIAMAEAGSTYVMNLPHIQTMRSVPSKGLNISSNLRVRQFGISDRDASSPSVTSSTGSNAGSYIKVSGFASIGSASTPAGIGYTTSSENGDAFKLDAEL
jgi:hypothetical protein